MMGVCGERGPGTSDSTESTSASVSEVPALT